MALLKKYWSTIRRLRVVHFLFNLSHKRKLNQNKPLYQKFGITKSVVGSLAHKDISIPGHDIPWLDRPDAVDALAAHRLLSTFPKQWQDQIRIWPERGYMVLEQFVSTEKCDRINDDLDQLIATGSVDFDYTESRVMNAWKHSKTIHELILDKALIEFLSFTLNKKTAPFQTISFLKGSRQKTHSDFIHMTTEPVGYLIATWLALEDINIDSGPLHYYPGSQKLPYVLGEDFDHSSSALFVGDDLYGNYEMRIAEVVKERQLKKEIFLAKKGDLLIWHANLLHGGEPVSDEKLSRKSLVTHYFCKGDVLCYHEITQRPAVIPEI